MEKFISDKMLSSQRDEMLLQKRGDNVRIVNHPIYGRVYICPYPPSHFPNLVADAKRIRVREALRTSYNPENKT